jgi:protocadherin Fat 1/2/3
MLNRFNKQEHAAEIYENQPIGTYVKHLEARSTSSLFFEILDGNKDDMFFINPSTGVIITKRQLDYELNKFYNLSVEATNMVSKRTCFFYVLEQTFQFVEQLNIMLLYVEY